MEVCTNIVSEQAALSGFSSLLPLSRNFGSSLGSTPGYKTAEDIVVFMKLGGVQESA